MAKINQTTYQQMQQYCEGATQTATWHGNEKYQRALKGLFERNSNELYRVEGTVKNGQTCLDVEIEGETYVLSHTESYFDAWSIVRKSQPQMSDEQAANQRARLNRMFGK